MHQFHVRREGEPLCGACGMCQRNDQQRKAHLLRGACAGANSAVTTGNPDDPGTAASNKMQARSQILSRARFKDHRLMQITAELPGQHP